MKTSLSIGLVFDYALPYTRGILRGIEQYAQSKPRWNLIFQDTHDFTRQRLKAMRPSGLIAHVVSRHLADVLTPRKRSVVNISFALANAPFARVGVNNREVGRLAFRHLHERGLRHFGLVGHPQHFFSTEREAGFLEAFDELRQSYANFIDQSDRSDAHRATPLLRVDKLQRWLQALSKPAGVFACHDVWGVQAVEACRLAGLRVPDDVAVVCVDTDNLLCERSRPSVSSILVPSEQIGYDAAALLERLLAGARPPRKPLLVSPAGVVTRKSSDTLAGSDPDLLAAVRFIRGSTDPICVDDVLRAVPLSRRSLERKFRAVLQCGIGEEIRRVQVERAKDLLATSPLSVTEVSGQAGFASVHHLSRVFRRQTGQTPTAYRNQFPTRAR